MLAARAARANLGKRAPTSSVEARVMNRLVPNLTATHVAYGVATLVAAAALVAGCGVAHTSGPLPQEVYVWQRAWTPAVREAVGAQAGDFDAVVVLAAEVGWERGRREVARAEVDWSLLTGARAVAVALRVGPFDRASEPHAAAGAAMPALAAEVVTAARAAGIAPRELQLDFDAPTAGLAAYAGWLDAVRTRVPDLPLVITALPTWLDSDAFAALLDHVDAVVLQVHSVTRPERPDALPPLCDPAAARRWIARAAALGRPFRVALPTYGYRLGFAPDGRLLGLTAEAPARAWPADTQLRELRADAPALAALVRALSADRPANLTAISWYRLPVAGDTLTWSAATFAAVRRGAPVAPAVTLGLAWPEPGLAEVRATNSGTADGALPDGVRVTWVGPAPLAADAAAGYRLADTLADTRLVRAGAGTYGAADPGAPPLAPGAVRTLGWLRFASPPPPENVVVTVVP